MNRKDHWENIYKTKSPADVSWYQPKPDISINLIEKYAPSKISPLIDVGGGASTLPDHLLQQGYKNISVLDLSSNALEHSKKRLGNNANSITWVVSDVTTFSSTKPYSLWHDRAVFHFLTDETDRKKYAAILNQSVNIGSYIIIAAFAIGGPTKCSGLEIVQYDETKLKKQLGEHFAFVEKVIEKHITPSGNEQAFGYYVFKKIS